MYSSRHDSEKTYNDTYYICFRNAEGYTISVALNYIPSSCMCERQCTMEVVLICLHTPILLRTILLVPLVWVLLNLKHSTGLSLAWQTEIAEAYHISIHKS